MSLKPAGALVTPILAAVLLLVILPSLFQPAEARTRKFCVAEPYYSGKDINCGGHLQPQCTSGAACDTGHNAYTINQTIDCPTIEQCTPFGCVTIYDVPDEFVAAGCYNRIPTCNDCGADGQPPCPAVAEPICGGCDEGFEINSVTGLCQIPGTPGQACGPGVGCSDGLTCDPFSFQCVGDAQAGQSCANPFVGCDQDQNLQCTLALECSNTPARVGETCDVSAPCGPGLYCQPGIPQRCIARRRPGESCNTFSPCVDGAVCRGDISGVASQCYPDTFAGTISESQCTAFYSANVAAGLNGLSDASNLDKTRTWFSGDGFVALTGVSVARGVAYGEEGSYGCFETVCNGIDIDISIETYIGKGWYDGYDDVAGESFLFVEEGQIPFSPVNVSLSQVYGNEGLSNKIGDEATVGIGLGASPLPLGGGTYGCETILTTVVGDVGGGVILPEPTQEYIPGAPLPPPVNWGALHFDGIDDVVIVDDPTATAALQAGAAMTLEFWMRPLRNGQSATLVSKDGEYRVGLVSGELVYALATGSPGWSAEVSTGAYPVNFDWTHVALVYGLFDGATESRLYVNGELKSRVAVNGPIGDALPDDDHFSIGAGPAGNAPFEGMIDSLRLWSITLSQIELFSGMNQDRFADAAGLQAGWRFDEPGDIALIDGGGAGIDLALDSAGADQAPERVAGGRLVTGGSLYLDGSKRHAAVLIPEFQDGLVASNALTLEAWVYPFGPGADPTYGGLILSKEGEYSLGRMPDGRIYFAIANSVPGWTTVVTDDLLPLNQWMHVAFTYDAGFGEINIYLNGGLVDTRPASGAIGDAHPESGQLRIGGRHRDETSSSNQKFHGVIDEVRIWNVARSAADLAGSYATTVDPISPGLEGYWRFDEGPTALIFDSTSATRHGLLGSGRDWESPSRADVTLLGAYPVALLQPDCNGGSCSLDTDGDGVSDYTDNCLLLPNPGQQDGDFDGYGNRCDADFDNSGFVNFSDLGYFRSMFGTSDAEADLDGNGFVNFIDLGLFRSRFGEPPGPSSLVP